MAGGKTTTQTTNASPWADAQPAMKLGLADAQHLYKQGIGSQPFTGSTVVPYAQQTTQGMDMQQGSANLAQPALQGNFNRVAANAANGGLNALQQGAVDRLSPMASGSMMNGNPFLDQMISKNARDMGDAVNLSASGAGRYGSGMHTDVLADSIGDMANTARFNNYGTERGHMQDAIGSLFNAGQQQQGNINGAAGALTSAYQGMMAPGSTMMDIGGMSEDLYGRTLNDQLRIFNDTQNAPWEQLGRLNAIASGAGQMGSTTALTAQGPSRLQAGLGGALGGGTMFGPLGAAAGGLLGAFG